MPQARWARFAVLSRWRSKRASSFCRLPIEGRPLLLKRALLRGTDAASRSRVVLPGITGAALVAPEGARGNAQRRGACRIQNSPALARVETQSSHRDARHLLPCPREHARAARPESARNAFTASSSRDRGTSRPSATDPGRRSSTVDFTGLLARLRPVPPCLVRAVLVRRTVLVPRSAVRAAHRFPRSFRVPSAADALAPEPLRSTALAVAAALVRERPGRRRSQSGPRPRAGRRAMSDQQPPA